MIKFDWKIKSIKAENNSLIQANYYVAGTDGTNTVDHESNWEFKKSYPITNATTEEDIVNFVRQESTIDDVNTIELIVENQLKGLKDDKTVELPWIANTFTIG